MRVAFSPRTYRDLDGIQAYIAKQSGNREVADRYVKRLVIACNTLAHSAERFPQYHIAGAVRMMPYDNYVIIFTVHRDEVRVGHIRHTARKPFRK